jgi:hypothetical protein
MSPRPTIFISAVSKELKSSRQLVSNTLQFLGYEPVWQDIFGTEQGDLRAMLREKVDGCKGVVQLVGKCYGAEPPAPDQQFGRVSYTQYEALYAKQRGKKVWYLFLDDDFPDDSHEAELEELRELQATYRRRLKSESQLYHPLSNREALETSVLKLRDDLARLRRTVKQWAVGVAVLLVVSVGIGVWSLQRQTQTSRNLVEVQSQLKQATLLLAGIQNQLLQEQSGKKNNTIMEDQAYAELAKKLGINEKLLRDKLPQFAEGLRKLPDTSTYEQANAAYVSKDYAGAEQLALQAAAGAHKAGSMTDAIKSFELAGWSANQRGEFANAFDYLRDAESLTDRSRDPAEWVQIQSDIGYILNEQNKYSQAADVLTGAIQERETLFGTNDSLALASRNNLAFALENQGKYDEAEAEYRAVWTFRENTLGATNADTLRSQNNLANALSEQGKYLEAGKEYAAVLTIREQVFGPADSETLGTRLNLSWCQILNRDFTDALSTAEMGLIQNPSYLPLEINRAHALLLLGRTQEAEAIYFKHEGQIIPELDNKLWQQIVLDDFNEFQKRGLYLAEMNDVRKMFDSNKK